MLLLVVIGGAMLAFIFSDNFSGGGGSGEILPLGTVYDEGIDEEEYEQLRTVYVDREISSAMEQNGGNAISDDQRRQKEQQAEDQAFNEVIRRNLMNREFDKLGIVCTTTELTDMLHGNHIHPWVEAIPMFRDRTGQFSRDSVRNYMRFLGPENEPLDNPDFREAWLQSVKQWQEFERELMDTRKADKYVTLIKNGLFVNSLEAEHDYYSKSETRSIRFVVQKYTDIPDSTVNLTDEDIKAYYDEHKDEKQFEMQESRDVDYVTFEVKPTEDDVQDIKEEMTSMKEKFAKTDENLSFMMKNSSIQTGWDTIEYNRGTTAFGLANPQFGIPGTITEEADDAVQESKVGDVIGPFSAVDQGTGDDIVYIAKVTKTRTEKQAWVRHILIQIDATRSEEEAKAMADSVIAEIKTNSNFVEMVQKVSEDPGSKETGGEYKWFAEGRMVPEFNDASFNGAIGQLQLVKTTYGYHIVEVLGRAERVIPSLAVVTKKVEPSENTILDREQMVFDFIYNVNNSDKDSAFFNISSDSGLTVLHSRVWINQNYINGMNDNKKMMGFLFNRNRLEGDISDPLFDGDKYVVAYLTNIIEEGTPEFEDVKEQMRFPALKDKKAAMYMDKMAGKENLEQVVQVMNKGQILNAQLTFGANVIAGGGGNEPEVIGSLFRSELQEGYMTVPLKGRTGVYVCILDRISPPAETSDYSEQTAYLTSSRRQTADNLVIRALREAADVQDNRRKREYQ
ncbi:peptidylprolyl isomerase [Paracrocinitomix mangrovi]|nr:peptidylprolyl isomerase [Paracrocinitomix mangrovi]